MKKCDLCGALIKNHVDRCPNCGQKIPKQKQKQSKPTTMLVCIFLIFVSIVMGSTVILTKTIFAIKEPEILIVSKTYDDYDEWKSCFVADSKKVEPYKQFFDNTINNFHNKDYESYHLEEFVVDQGVFVDGYFLEDFVYKNTELTMALYYVDENEWELHLQYQSLKSDSPVLDEEIMQVFEDIASLNTGILKACFARFESAYEGVAYLKEYFVKEGTIKYTYFDRVTSYELKLPIRL